MKACHTRYSQREESGFTLVELMIALAIFGLLTTAVIIALPNTAGALEEDAQRFAARTAALRDNAILQSRPMAVQVTRSGYSFLERRRGGWTALDDKPFASTGWSQGVSAVVDDAESLLISFESTGLTSDPAEVTLRYKDEQRSIYIASMGDVKLEGTSK